MSRSTYLDRIADDADLDELMADLARVRAAAADAAEKEARARAVRERLEMEAATLERLVSFVRSARRLDGPIQVLTGVVQTLGEWSGIVQQNLNPSNMLRPAVNTADNDAGTTASAPRKPVPKRGLIAQIIRDHPERDGWSPPAMRAELNRRGVDDDTQLVRVTMRRMERRRQLTRGDDGLYRLGPALDGGQPQTLGDE